VRMGKSLGGRLEQMVTIIDAKKTKAESPCAVVHHDLATVSCNFVLCSCSLYIHTVYAINKPIQIQHIQLHCHGLPPDQTPHQLPKLLSDWNLFFRHDSHSHGLSSLIP